MILTILTVHVEVTCVHSCARNMNANRHMVIKHSMLKLSINDRDCHPLKLRRICQEFPVLFNMIIKMHVSM